MSTYFQKITKLEVWNHPYVQLFNNILIFLLLVIIIILLYTIFNNHLIINSLVLVLCLIIFQLLFMFDELKNYENIYLYLYSGYFMCLGIYFLLNSYLKNRYTISRSSILLLVRIKTFTIILIILINELFFNLKIVFIGIPFIVFMFVGLIGSLNLNQNNTDYLDNLLESSKIKLYDLLFYLIVHIYISNRPNLRYGLLVFWVLFHIYCNIIIQGYTYLIIPIIVLTIYYYIPGILKRDLYALNYDLYKAIMTNLNTLYENQLNCSGDIPPLNDGNTPPSSEKATNKVVARAARNTGDITQKIVISKFVEYATSMPVEREPTLMEQNDMLERHLQYFMYRVEELKQTLKSDNLTDTQELETKRDIDIYYKKMDKLSNQRSNIIDLMIKKKLDGDIVRKELEAATVNVAKTVSNALTIRDRVPLKGFAILGISVVGGTILLIQNPTFQLMVDNVLKVVSI